MIHTSGPPIPFLVVAGMLLVAGVAFLLASRRLPGAFSRPLVAAVGWFLLPSPVSILAQLAVVYMGWPDAVARGAEWLTAGSMVLAVVYLLWRLDRFVRHALAGAGAEVEHLTDFVIDIRARSFAQAAALRRIQEARCQDREQRTAVQAWRAAAAMALDSEPTGTHHAPAV